MDCVVLNFPRCSRPVPKSAASRRDRDDDQRIEENLDDALISFLSRSPGRARIWLEAWTEGLK